MKKKILSILSILMLVSAFSVASAKTVISSDLANAIKLYKAGNYVQCYSTLENVIKKDRSNALAYYYMAITSVQLGRKQDAITNYDKAISLANPNGNISAYARKGKICIETPESCHETIYSDPDEDFIKNSVGQFSEEARSKYEKLKIENMMREMNRSDDINPQKFKDFKDFSSMNNQSTPTDEEIVAAMRILQKAGLTNIFSNNYATDLNMLTGNQNPQNQLLNMMGNTSVTPQLIQSMLNNNMTLGF